jgi:DNA gyrase/topoisomerase IV subunit B
VSSRCSSSSRSSLSVGTVIRFKADSEIFSETTVYNYETLQKRIRELAFLNNTVPVLSVLPISLRSN